jgi:TolB-like protein
MLVRPLIMALAVAIAFLGSGAARAQAVEYQKVTAEGTGADYDAALNMALTQAVAQINGIAVARRVVTQSVHGSASEEKATKSGALLAVTTDKSATVAGVANADLGDTQPPAAPQTDEARIAGTTLAAQDRDNSPGIVTAKAAAVETTQAASMGGAAQVTRQDFTADRAIVTMASETAGIINRYQIVSTEQQQNTWHVVVMAEISVYKATEQNQRKKVAVLPLRMEKADVRFRQFENVFRTDLVNQLTQSSKLAVLDRDFASEQDSELNFLKSDGVKKEEMARLGNKLGADYVIVGVVTDATVKAETAYIQSIGRTVTGPSTAAAKISYRVIETATGRIELADSWETTGRPSGKLEDTAGLASEEVARSIMDALFPMRVERVSNGVFYLGQGGKSVKAGEQYRVVRLGNDIVDSYTNEIIGREEEDIGVIAIFEIEPKLAKARLVGAALQPLPADATGLVVRLVKNDNPAGAASTGAAPPGKRPDPGKTSVSDAKALLEKKKNDW